MAYLPLPTHRLLLTTAYLSLHTLGSAKLFRRGLHFLDFFKGQVVLYFDCDSDYHFYAVTTRIPRLKKNALRTDGPTDGWPDPHIEMRGRF